MGISDFSCNHLLRLILPQAFFKYHIGGLLQVGCVERRPMLHVFIFLIQRLHQT
jgi:hypothetical protein